MPYQDAYSDRPSHSDLAQEQWESDRKSRYPRGYGPPRGRDEDPDPEMEHYEDHDPARFLSDPGFDEGHFDEPDPDRWHDDHKTGGILSQRDQWPDRVAGIQRSTESELKGKKPVINTEVHRVPGLYGEDEDDPYDVYATRSPDGKGWDVINQIGR